MLKRQIGVPDEDAEKNSAQNFRLTGARAFRHIFLQQYATNSPREAGNRIPHTIFAW